MDIGGERGRYSWMITIEFIAKKKNNDKFKSKGINNIHGKRDLEHFKTSHLQKKKKKKKAWWHME